MCLFSLYCPYNEKKVKLEGAYVQNAIFFFGGGGGGQKYKKIGYK